jgi:predicted RNA-binding Zn ribbon-like protein
LEELVNTANPYWYGDSDRLDSPRTLARWLEARDLVEPDTPVGKADLKAIRRFRESLRRLMQSHAGRELEGDEVSSLNGVLDRAGLRLRYDRMGQPKVVSIGSGAGQAIGRLANLVLEATIAGQWSRIKACQRCGWGFYDRSRNKQGRWCTMDVCGNQVKVQAFRARKRTVAVSRPRKEAKPSNRLTGYRK